MLNPATEYVAKFTEEIEKSRVVHARVLANLVDGEKRPEGEAVRAGATIQNLARQLINDTREELPVVTSKGEYLGVMKRQEALDILLGAD